MSDSTSQTTLPTELRLALLLDSAERLISAEPGVLLFNAAAFSPGKPREIDAQVSQTLAEAKTRGALQANPSFQFVNDDVLRSVGDSRLDQATIGHLRSILSHYIVQTKEMRGGHWVRAPYPKFDLASQHCIFRYGNVELRVLENYLTDREALRTALFSLIEVLRDEAAMYGPGRPTSFLAADDVQRNIRKLITNAGFYVRDDPEAAWDALDEWAGRYLQAIRKCQLAANPPHYPFFFGVQRAIWEAWGEVPSYVHPPSVFEFYDSVAGCSVLFMSPLAHMVTQQAETGRLFRLFRNYRTPGFSLRALPAWISTWPNRPHNDWAETFAEMCRTVDTAFEKQPADVFLASCGCYGLPICDYARSKYGCRTAYLGNITHAYFGVRQGATRDFMRDQVDSDMWIDGDLSQYANVDRIDAGRYV